MVPFLAFDSRSITELVDLEKHDAIFRENEDFPLFFKSRDGRTAMDVALFYN